MRFFLVLILMMAIGMFAVQLYRLIGQYNNVKREQFAINAELEAIKIENEKLTADLDYFNQKEHLEREMRKADYALPDEKVLIIIPEIK